ncbi:hypothetical protein OG369_05790 [Streptomyces sp. NBC_01221]|uniref:hypothetical protein n=1 Tax=unclassified Streptomyces TaxID=2593676 RepID=UPI00224F143D|nr:MULTISPECIES: hypothetical protein [unclassified Streptomyces]MCX4785699.1 hypothetical protein [Streptomyces sp. NBC_01221]WSJ41354.1 hypothetical protein OG772_29145 [Streptomyces sp. NBC_01321]WSP60372.1 hypothetical protein OG306_07190 [Streptomyces sp. NBC_01241]WSU26763.1 hypothetical protein OG508_32150 [Streptomyces sp. NBC_01108]
MGRIAELPGAPVPVPVPPERAGDPCGQGAVAGGGQMGVGRVAHRAEVAGDDVQATEP